MLAIIVSSCRRRAIVTTIVFRHGKIAAAAKTKDCIQTLVHAAKLSHSNLFLSTIVENFTSCKAKIVKIKLFTSHAENEIVTSIVTHHPVNRRIVKVQNNIVDIVSI